MNRFQALQIDVDDVTSIMRANINMVLERGETLSALEEQSEMLQANSIQFCSKAARLQRKRSINVGSILQPVSDFFSSLLRRKSVSDPVQTASEIHHQQPQDTEVDWPSDEQQLVDRFIERQQYDGLWILTEEDVKQLTDKSLTHFASPVLDKIEKSKQQMITTTALVIALLEKRYISSKTLWQTLSNKAYKRLIDLLNGDQEKVEQLMKDIRDQLM
jgi:ribosomal protein S10